MGAIPIVRVAYQMRCPDANEQENKVCTAMGPSSRVYIVLSRAAPWSSQVSSSGSFPEGRGFKSHRRHCIDSLV